MVVCCPDTSGSGSLLLSGRPFHCYLCTSCVVDRKYNLCGAFLRTVSLWEVPFRSLEIVVPRNLKLSTVNTVLLRTVRGGSVGGLLLKSTVISTVLSGFKSRWF